MSVPAEECAVARVKAHAFVSPTFIIHVHDARTTITTHTMPNPLDIPFNWTLVFVEIFVAPISQIIIPANIHPHFA